MTCAIVPDVNHHHRKGHHMIRSYTTALAAIRRDFYPGSSLPAFLAREFAHRATLAPGVVTSTVALVRAGQRSPRFLLAQARHRVLDVVHPFGDQRGPGCP